ncbi:mobilization protein [Clostridia bacterium]|nr:mobilization protein [Clostridia bacterium]
MTEKRRRGVLIRFRVSEREQDLIAERMERAGIRNREAYLRKQAIDGYVLHLDLSGVNELIYLLRTVANNMNQIAKRANETRSIYEADILDLQSRYDSLWEKADGILRALAEIRR